MRQTAIRLAKSYTPMIKFVGARHPVIHHTGGAGAHACALDGVAPGSSQCLPAAEYLKKLQPFEVVSYKVKSTPKRGISGTDKRGYTYTDRALQENEVASVLSLPKRFRVRPLEDPEIDVINAGGAL
ncbi:LAQU0S14e03158g1_1 [Lachancea quebecensis]|uniref:LAQU0S14e03158g1_1 n=1 Tax=Lachancea quebecensis TaxID=1654605 RepID=A0A0P1KVF1_9SACH|nr:LAQU0S14e03158g1_1 [Lachancea quebecensis]